MRQNGPACRDRISCRLSRPTRGPYRAGQPESVCASTCDTCTCTCDVCLFPLEVIAVGCVLVARFVPVCIGTYVWVISSFNSRCDMSHSNSLNFDENLVATSPRWETATSLQPLGLSRCGGVRVVSWPRAFGRAFVLPRRIDSSEKAMANERWEASKSQKLGLEHIFLSLCMSMTFEVRCGESVHATE